jgi:protein ImuB
LQNEETFAAPPPNLTFAIYNLQFAISSLPIEALRIPPDTSALLRQLGIETVAQLLALPREDLTSRFGESLLLRIDQWTGAAAEVLTPHRAPDPLVVRYEFEHPTGDRDTLTHVLSALVGQLARRLAARDEGALQLICEIGCVGGEWTPLPIGLFEPSASARQWMELLGLHLENVRLTAEVARVTLRAGIIGRLGARQGELFVDGWPRDPHQWALLVNRLSSRLGTEQVLRAELRESALPERACHYLPATKQGKKMQIANCKLKNANRKAKRPSHNLQFAICDLQSPPRPLLLYPEPHPIDVTCVAPSGPPQFIWFDHRRERIVQHWGPERVETLWWRGPSVRRDYYRVSVESGGHLWLFRRLGDERWFLHGVFS